METLNYTESIIENLDHSSVGFIGTKRLVHDKEVLQENKKEDLYINTPIALMRTTLFALDDLALKIDDEDYKILKNEVILPSFFVIASHLGTAHEKTDEIPVVSFD